MLSEPELMTGQRIAVSAVAVFVASMGALAVESVGETLLATLQKHEQGALSLMMQLGRVLG